jgi:hydroxymethylpyrimidine/phosphomethylpyrimidine kinase
MILFIGGHDPSGGAGLQADLETAFSFGCRATSLVTCLTAQDSHNVKAIHPQRAGDFEHQARLLLSDIQPSVIKIGLLGDAQIARATATLLETLQLPVVLDPVLAAGGGKSLANESLLQVIREQLLPLTTLLTPNRAEARRLSGMQDIDRSAQALLGSGCKALLITGADETDSDEVRNTLYQAEDRQDYEWPRLPHVYHGSGCTLSSACACELSSGKPIEQAVQQAQKFTWEALKNAKTIGSGQRFPTRRSMK